MLQRNLLFPFDEGRSLLEVGEIESDLVALLDAIVVGFLREDEGDDAEIDEVRLVDPGEGLRNDRLYSEVHRGESGVLAARSLAVVVAADDEAAASLPRPLRKGGINGFEDVLRDGGDVGAQGEDLGAGGHDVVGSDIVADLEEDFGGDLRGQRLPFRQGLDVGPADDIDVLRLLFLLRRNDHVVVDREDTGRPDLRLGAEGAGVGDLPGEGRSRRQGGAHEVDVGIFRPAPSLKVTVEGTK